METQIISSIDKMQPPLGWGTEAILHQPHFKAVFRKLRKEKTYPLVTVGRFQRGRLDFGQDIRVGIFALRKSEMGFCGQDPQFNMSGLGRQCFLVQILKTTDSDCVTIFMFKTELILSGFEENDISTDIQCKA